jgi:serine protease Do
VRTAETAVPHQGYPDRLLVHVSRIAQRTLAIAIAICASIGLPTVFAGSESKSQPVIQTAPAENAAADPALKLAHAQQEVFRAAVAGISPCVVTIETVGGSQPVEGGPPGSRPAGAPRMPAPGPGFIVADGPTTGLIYSADGLIITSAFNFVRDPSLITVVLADRRRFVAEFLARDEVRQLAMIKIEAKDLPTPTWLEDLSQLRVGQWAIALGRGLGGEQPAVTSGIISGLNRQSGLAVQTDARLSPANYGGPVIDIEGRVIGLAVPMGLTTGVMAGVELYDSGIGFAIPYTQIHASAESLAIGHNLRRGLLGIRLGGRNQMMVLGVADPSPAMRAGLQKGDRLLAMNGQPVKKYQELQRIMRARLAGQPVTVTIERGKERLDISVVLAVPEDLGKLPTGDEPKPESRPTPESPEPPHRERE